MKRFKNIAVLLNETDDDDHILKRAAELAKINTAVLSVYTVFDKDAYVPDMDDVLYPPEEVLSHLKKAKQERLKRIVEDLRKDDVLVSGKVITGRPFVRVIQEVQKNQHDVLMLPANREGGPPTMFLGGTPMHLLRKCPCPVWVFRSRKKRAFRRIMAAVNVATRRREELELNIKIMELATSLAEQEDAELHIVHCWTAFAESILLQTGNLSREGRESYSLNFKKQHEALLQTLLEPYSLNESKTQIHLPKGEAGILVPELVEEHSIDLLLMGTVARSGIPGLLIGNTAEKILNSLPCSVLAVKPDGFVSPVPHPDRPKK